MLVVVHPHTLVARDAGEVADEAGLAHTGVSLQQEGWGERETTRETSSRFFFIWELLVIVRISPEMK